MQAKELGKYIVADPEICHGQLTFKGTRIFVSSVLKMVAKGMSWDRIIEEWRGSITKEAISEAVLLASKSLLAEYSGEKIRPEETATLGKKNNVGVSLGDQAISELDDAVATIDFPAARQLVDIAVKLMLHCINVGFISTQELFQQYQEGKEPSLINGGLAEATRYIWLPGEPRRPLPPKITAALTDMRRFQVWSEQATELDLLIYAVASYHAGQVRLGWPVPGEEQEREEERKRA